MRPIMKSESGNGSKGLVWDRESQAIEQNKRLDRNGTMPKIQAEQNGRIGQGSRIAMDQRNQTFRSEQNNARDSNRAERDI